MSNEDLQVKIKQKAKLVQDKKKLLQNLKNLDQVHKEVQLDIDKIMPEKTKFEEWARYFGNDGKSKQVLSWFSEELKKHQQKLERVQNMRDKILGVQEKLDQQIDKIDHEIQDSEEENEKAAYTEKSTERIKTSKPEESKAATVPARKEFDKNYYRKDSHKHKNRFSGTGKKYSPAESHWNSKDNRQQEQKSISGRKNENNLTQENAPADKVDNLEAFKKQLQKSGLAVGNKVKPEAEKPASTEKIGLKISEEKLAEIEPVKIEVPKKELIPETESEMMLEPLDSVLQPEEIVVGKVETNKTAKSEIINLKPQEILSTNTSESEIEEETVAEEVLPKIQALPVALKSEPENEIVVAESIQIEEKEEVKNFDLVEIVGEKPVELKSEVPVTPSLYEKVEEKEEEEEEEELASVLQDEIVPEKERPTAKESEKKSTFKSLFGRFSSKAAVKEKEDVEEEFHSFLEADEKLTGKKEEKSEPELDSEKKYDYIQQQPLRAKTTETKITEKTEIPIKVEAEVVEPEKVVVEQPEASQTPVELNFQETEWTETSSIEVLPGTDLSDAIEDDIDWMNQEVRSEIKRMIMTPSSKAESLYVGIDLGTFETTIAASNGMIASTISAVGWAKDIVSKRFLKKDILFGDEAMKNKLALDFYRPLEDGVIKETEKDQEAARELIKHVLKLVKPEEYKKVYAVIGAPAQASLRNQQAILDAAREIIDAVTIISEPFAVAYGEANIYNSLVIDIGAGTTDICRLRGTMPAPEDQISFTKAGDYIDYQLMDCICQRVKGAQVGKDMVRRWKEAYSFVGKPSKPIIVEITVEGKPLKVDISSSIMKACEAIVADIETSVIKLISTFDPEFQPALKQNILLAGGGSLIRNLDLCLQERLKPMGNVIIKKVRNPIEAGAIGALSLAMDVTDEYWRGI